MAGAVPASTLRILGLGIRGRCPRCGEGRLFDGFLDIARDCTHCGLGFGGHDAGDAPAFAVILVLGAGVVGLAYLVEVWLAPPLWLHAVLWTPVVVGGAVLLLRPLKGLMVALQFRFRSLDETEAAHRC